jgi:hypothetical protein
MEQSIYGTKYLFNKVFMEQSIYGTKYSIKIILFYICKCHQEQQQQHQLKEMN